jgi:hypothetical protein
MARKLRLGGEFPELADLQLRPASEVLRDMEALFGPLDRRAEASEGFGGAEKALLADSVDLASWEVSAPLLPIALRDVECTLFLAISEKATVPLPPSPHEGGAQRVCPQPTSEAYRSGASG